MPNEDLEKQIQEYEEETKKPNLNQPKKKKTKWKYIVNISLVLIFTILAVVLAVYDNFNEIVNNLKRANWIYIGLIVGIVFVCILIKGLILFCFARLYTRKYKFHQALACDQVGTFYNAVTPGSSGGQFMQAYTFKKQGMPISSAVSIMAMYSIIYQGVLILYGLLSFAIKYDFIIGINNLTFNIFNFEFSIPIWLLTIVGFFLNLSIILLVFLMAYWKGFHNFIMGPCISFLHKLKLIKDSEKSRESLRVQVENFKIEFRRLMTNIPFTILVSVLFFAYMTIKFSIPYFAGIALGNQSAYANFWDAVFLSNYHQMVTGLIPIPGSAGVSEYFFSELFVNQRDLSKGFYYIAGITSSSDSTVLCRSALLIWRTATFTLPLVAAGIVTAFYRGTPKEEVGRKGFPNHQTFVELQSETYAIRKSEFDTLLETKQLSRQAIQEKLFNKRKSKTNQKDSNINSKKTKNEHNETENKESKPKKPRKNYKFLEKDKRSKKQNSDDYANYNIDEDDDSI